MNVDARAIGEKHLVYGDDGQDGEVGERARELLARGRDGLRHGRASEEVFVSSFAPRPRMYVFGAIDFASTLASIGRFLGYHVTVCDARAKFVTPERFPDVDELVVDWPDRFLASAPVDERTAICVLTHDSKFDVPILKNALSTSPAGYIGAMGSRRTTERRNERLREEGVTRRAARARARADRPPDRLPQPGGGRRRDRGRDHLGVQREDAARLADEGRRSVKLENSFEVPAPREEAWELLMDVPRVIPCMPGATLVETVSTIELEGRHEREARARSR